jgi:hypothetical protein
VIDPATHRTGVPPGLPLHHRRGCGEEDTVSLTNVWLRTLDEELIQAFAAGQSHG